jgi:hypothetical protein
MTIAGNILRAIGHAFASLFKSAETHFTPEDQAAILNGSMIPQIIKQNLDLGELAIIQLITTRIGMPPTEVQALLQGLYKQFNVATLSEYQNILKSSQGSVWMGILETSAKILAIALSNGKLTWESLGLGLLQYAYNSFIAGK